MAQYCPTHSTDSQPTQNAANHRTRVVMMMPAATTHWRTTAPTGATPTPAGRATTPATMCMSLRHTHSRSDNTRQS
ncbi:hypothetical protein AA106556_2022 [Neokomagataea tanensis NBRC 106556]|uniref:Uncharacterized protein n=1 Tax=Neokomagataea tanensis NBRC 106556 TaxID=1223519 RepID=A0ABQ0QLN3_9PROT|nr:hypothetical protein AA106556_2022 [Neokomagataea tanensis NBRC 106556]